MEKPNTLMSWKSRQSSHRKRLFGLRLQAVHKSKMKHFTTIVVIAATLLLVGCHTPTIVGTWRTEGRDDTTVFRQDGTWTFNTIWVFGPTGNSGPQNVATSGKYTIVKPNYMTLQTITIDGAMIVYPPPNLEFRYSVTSKTLTTELITTNKEYEGKIFKYFRVENPN